MENLENGESIINRILGENKCFSVKGISWLTPYFLKYIYDKLPIVIYETPGFEKPDDIESVQK